MITGSFFRFTFFAFISCWVFTGCVILPVNDEHYRAKCEISSDKKTLRVVDVTKEAKYYALDSYLLTPILIPASAIVSATYVAVNNIYNLGEEKIVCE